VCWGFEDGDDLREVAVSFLRAGVDAGERVMWIGEGDDRVLVEAIADVGNLDDLIGEGRLTVRDVRAAYQGGDAATTVEHFRSLSAAALRDGYTGLRVIADNTPLARDDEARLDFVAYERLVDDMIGESPIVGMCAFDTSALGDDGVADIACVHPARGGRMHEPSFSLYRLGDVLVLSGEVDLAHANRFAAALRGSSSSTVSCLELSGLKYIDIAGARQLAGLLQNIPADRSIEVTGVPDVLDRCWQMLGFSVR
jgi:ABC-type transporter Mla MlaB component